MISCNTRSNQNPHSYWLLKLGFIIISKHWQSQNGLSALTKVDALCHTTGWSKFSFTNNISASKSRPNFIFKISTKLHNQNLDQTFASNSASRYWRNLSLNIFTKIQLQSIDQTWVSNSWSSFSFKIFSTHLNTPTLS